MVGTEVTIYTKSELIKYIKEYNTGTKKHATLINDIYLANTDILIPLGNESMPYNNTFTGQGYTIYNLQINSFKNVGFIGVLGNNGNIKQVNFGTNSDRSVPHKIKSNSLGKQYGCGIVVGKNKGGVIEQIKVSGNYSVEGYCNVGGICGYNEITEGEITTVGSNNRGQHVQYCSLQIKGDIIGTNNVGGIIGKNERLITYQNAGVTGCSNLSHTCDIRGNENVGGIVGHNINMDISLCNLLMEGNIISHFNAGGCVGKNESKSIAGHNPLSCKINNVIISLIGDIKSKENTGGIVGYNKGIGSEIIDCVNSMNGNINYRRNAGGIIGRNNGLVHKCQNLMNGNIENDTSFEQYYNVILSAENTEDMDKTISRPFKKNLMMKAVNNDVYYTMDPSDSSIHNFYDVNNNDFKTYATLDTFENNKYNFWIEDPIKFKKINANEFNKKENYVDSSENHPSETRNSFYKYEIDKDNQVYKGKKTIDIDNNAKFSFGVAHKEDWYFSNKSNIEINKNFSYLVNADRLRTYLKEDNRECLKLYKERKFVFDNNIHHWIVSLFQLIKDLRHPDGLIGLHNRYGGINNVATLDASNHSLAILPISRLDQTRIDEGDQQLAKLTYDQVVGSKERQNFNDGNVQGWGGEAQNFDVQTRNDNQMFYWQIPFRLSYNFNTTNPFLDVRTMPSKNFIDIPNKDYDIGDKPEKRFIYLKDYNAWNLSGNPKYGSRYHGILPSVKQGVETRMTGVKGRFIPRSPIEQDLSYLCKLQEQIDGQVDSEDEVKELGKKYGLNLTTSFEKLKTNFEVLYTILQKGWNNFISHQVGILPFSSGQLLLHRTSTYGRFLKAADTISFKNYKKYEPMLIDKLTVDYHSNKLKGYSNNLNLNNDEHYLNESYSILDVNVNSDHGYRWQWMDEAVNEQFEKKALVAGLANILYLQFLSIGPTWHKLLYDTEGMYDRLKKISLWDYDDEKVAIESPPDPFQNFIKLNLQTDCDPYMFPFELQQITNNFNTLPHAVFNSNQFVTNQPINDARNPKVMSKIKHDIDNNWWSDETLKGSNKYSYSFEAAYNLFYYMTEDNIFLDISKNSQPVTQSKVWRLNPANNAKTQKAWDIDHKFFYDSLITKRLEMLNKSHSNIRFIEPIHQVQIKEDEPNSIEETYTAGLGIAPYFWEEGDVRKDIPYGLAYILFPENLKSGKPGMSGFDWGANQVSNEGSYNNISYSVIPNNYLLNKLWNRTIFRRDVHTSNKFFPKIYNTLLNYEYLCSTYDNIDEPRKNKLKESINVLKMPMGNINTYFCSSGIDKYFKNNNDALSNEINGKIKKIFYSNRPNTNLKENPNSNFYISTLVSELYDKYKGFNIKSKNLLNFIDYNVYFRDNYDDFFNSSNLYAFSYNAPLYIRNDLRKSSNVNEYLFENAEIFKKEKYLNINTSNLVENDIVNIMTNKEFVNNIDFKDYYKNSMETNKLFKILDNKGNDYNSINNLYMKYNVFYAFDKRNQYYNFIENIGNTSFYTNGGISYFDNGDLSCNVVRKYLKSESISDGVLKHHNFNDVYLIEKSIQDTLDTTLSFHHGISNTSSFYNKRNNSKYNKS